jgi:hypothetical protein
VVAVFPVVESFAAARISLPFPDHMFTLPGDATDDDLCAGVIRWFTLVASGALADASEYLDGDSPDAMTVEGFIKQVAHLTAGGKVSIPEPFPSNADCEELPIDGPTDIVCHWIPGPDTTEKHPGFIADILYTVPVDGAWSEVDASFFVRRRDDQLTIQLRDVVRLADV